MTFVLVQVAGPAGSAAQEVLGGIRGMISDGDFGGPVPNAVVRLSEKAARQKTGSDGHFLFENVEAGAYTLIISKSGYERHVQSDVVVVPGALADVAVELKGEFVEMEEVVVRELKLDDAGTEIGLLAMRETSLSFQDSISRDLMSKAGASDAASALKLVTGASVADGKYATVRGLSDRYVGTSVNGIRVPSSDPKKRAVQIDVFPSGTIESMSVHKTFTPDLPGDWSGGGIDIKTLSIPEKSFLKVSFSREVHSDTGKDGWLTYEGGGCGAWGRHDGTRGMPDYSGYPSAQMTADFAQKADGSNSHSPDFQRVDEITKSFDPAMGVKRGVMPGNFSFSMSSGHAARLGGGWRFGTTTAFTYSKKYSMDVKEEQSAKFDTSGAAELVEKGYERETGQEELKWSMLLSLGLNNDDKHIYTITLLRNRTATDRASLRVQTNLNASLWYSEAQTLHYAERSVQALQFKGEHNLPDIIKPDLGTKVEWYGAHSVAEQEEPDIRNFENYVIQTNDYYVRGFGDPTEQSGSDPLDALRMWRNTKEDNTQYGLDLTIPFYQQVADIHEKFGGATGKENVWSREKATFRVGTSWDWTKRVYQQKTFAYDYAPFKPGGYPSDNIEDHGGPGQQDFLWRPSPPYPPFTYNPNWQDDYQTARTNWLQSAEGQRWQEAADAKKDHINNGDTHTTTDPDALWTDDFTGADYLGLGPYVDQMRWYIIPSPFREVEYEGFQKMRGGYWMLELPLTKQLKGMCGARLEFTDMSIEPTSSMGNSPIAFLVPEFNYSTSQNDAGETEEYPLSATMGSTDTEGARAEIKDSSWLRSAGFTYKIKPQMNFRYNWSQTIARPTFRELAPVVNLDFIDNELYVGNSDLELVRLRNTDVRWEWFPAPGDVFAVSWFSKIVEDPIELWDFGYLSRVYTTSLNYPEGKVNGWEFEARRSFEQPLGLPGKLTFGSNYTKIDAQVRLVFGLAEKLEQGGVLYLERDDDGEPVTKDIWRDMRDQPEDIYNVNLMYDLEKTGTSLGIFYNVTGETLKKGPSLGDAEAFPSVYKKRLPTINLSLSQKVRNAKLTFRAKNVNDPFVEEVYRYPDPDEEGEIIETPRSRYKKGISYSVSVGFSW